LTTKKYGEGRVPKYTAVAPVKPAPQMETMVPPLVGPVLGETWLTDVGAVLV
jgi:hypothetical protein